MIPPDVLGKWLMDGWIVDVGDAYEVTEKGAEAYAGADSTVPEEIKRRMIESAEMAFRLGATPEDTVGEYVVPRHYLSELTDKDIDDAVKVGTMRRDSEMSVTITEKGMRNPVVRMCVAASRALSRIQSMTETKQ
jgi:hypothetical protein